MTPRVGEHGFACGWPFPLERMSVGSVGRAGLEALLARAADGPVLATVVGKAGVGKSALVAEVLRARKSLLVLTGGGGAIPGLEALQSPFGVFTEPPSEHSHRSTA